jgi:hypothetical protein
MIIFLMSPSLYSASRVKLRSNTGALTNLSVLLALKGRSIVIRRKSAFPNRRRRHL